MNSEVTTRDYHAIMIFANVWKLQTTQKRTFSLGPVVFSHDHAYTVRARGLLCACVSYTNQLDQRDSVLRPAGMRLLVLVQENFYALCIHGAIQYTDYL